MRAISRQGHDFFVCELPSTLDWDFWGLFENESWEKESFQYLDEVLSPGDLLFDVGAWVGPFTLWEASRGVRVVAFEPDSVAYKALMDSVQKSGLSNLVTAHKTALSDKTGETVLRIYEEGDSKSSLTKNFPIRKTIQCDTLENMIAVHGMPKAIKMDIEGGESLVLPRAGKLLRENNVTLLLSLHWGYYAEGTKDSLYAELEHWNMLDISDQDVYLCTAKP